MNSFQIELQQFNLAKGLLNKGIKKILEDCAESERMETDREDEEKYCNPIKEQTNGKQKI